MAQGSSCNCSRKGRDDFQPDRAHEGLTFLPRFAWYGVASTLVVCMLMREISTGNRSPLADPRMRGSFVGLSLDNSVNDLALKFNVTLEVCVPPISPLAAL